MMDRTKWNQRTPTSWIAVTALLVFACFWVACGGGAGSANNTGWNAITPPKLTGILPASGPTTGGTTVAITGTDIQKGATVLFGNVPAAKINSVTSTSIEAVAPVHDPGIVDVTVTNPDTKSDTLLGAFTFEGSPPPIVGPPPTISSVLPNSGPVVGGTVVTITGTHFQSGATVTFGQSPAAAVVFSSATQFLATTPAHAQGTVDVIVRNPDGQSATVSSGFTYQPVPAPTIISLLPTSGPAVGGTLVSIAGANFLAAATVSFGGEPATPVTVTSSAQIDAVTPAHAAGVVDVWVTNLDSQLATLASGFTYVLPPPTISGVSPTTGPIGGGTVVTITGTNFQNSATVTFAGVAATSATVNSSTRIAATTPAHAAGTAAVNVTNPDNQSATLPGAFTYTSGSITAGCGAGTDNSDCGNVGDPYEGGSFNPTGKTAVSACLNPMAADTAYYLTGNVGADATAICFGLSNGVTLDLRTFTVTGRIDMTGLNANGITIFNGSVNCNISPTPAACVSISSGSAYTAKTRLHHLTVHNSAEPGGGALAAILFDWTGLDGTNLAIEVDHITGYVQTALTSSRAIFLRVTSAKKADIHNNDLTCDADVMACNLVEAIPGAGYVNGAIHHNRATITTNTISGSSPRAFTISGPDSTSIGTQGWRVYNNVCRANNGRCFRFRQVSDLQVHDNQVLNCVATGFTGSPGCYHFADPSTGPDFVSDAQAVIYNETIALDTGGVGFWLINGNGWTVRDVTVIGTHGKLGGLSTSGAAPAIPTIATFCRITGASGLDTDSTAAANTTVNIFDAGNWSGAGTVNVLAGCP